MISAEHRASLLAEKIAQAKAEVSADIESGRVPPEVGCLADLQSHVDANCYGGCCDDGECERLLSLWGGPVQIGCMVDATPEDLQDFFMEIQEELNRWIVSGRPQGGGMARPDVA